ncbi:hypothetical protein Taro_024735 [Colocasia esculenta]|uniref:TF-B3 domain-containing protein n=1 Tax=Colocasia esculenta TaxID=4460 RepID=A0A843VC56_COLES|nr:hypothetical protein [Colocasia esculenta]
MHSPKHAMTENQLQVWPRKFKFFRVLLLGFATKLAIPQRLTKYFIRVNLTRVTLLSPLCKTWNVKISGDREGLHFGEGWERFATAHDLRFGDLLVFKSVGGLAFHVTIFDKTTCEREYYNVGNIGVPGDDDHVPGQGESSEKESDYCIKSRQTSCSSGEWTFPVTEQESSKDQLERSACRIKKGPQKPVCHKAKEATKQGYKRGSHFAITISPKYKYSVNIPLKFARSNDLSSVHQMLLRDPEGRPWPVNLLHYKQSVGNDGRYFLLSAGWRHFHVRNHLKDGDVCVFELKKKNEMFVKIHRSCGGANMTNQDEYGSRRNKSPLQQAVQLKRAATLQQKWSPLNITHISKPADPVQFRSTIFPSTVCKGRYMITIPVSFLSLVDLSGEKEAILVDPNSRRWPVKIRHTKTDGRCRIGKGWEAFCKENDLEVGDVCVFNFKYRGREATFQVEVIKSKPADGSRRSKSSLQQTVQLKRAATLLQKWSPLKNTHISKPADPVQFMSTIVPSNVRKSGYMTIPMSFLSFVDLSGERDAILVDPNSRRWPVKILHIETDGRCRIGHGWEAFCKENDLEVGDVCVFDFKYRGREATFQVEVIKSKPSGKSDNPTTTPRFVSGT